MFFFRHFVFFFVIMFSFRYTKYLYPLECKVNNLSNPNDLQSAIEGNKREGRTSSYGPYGGMGMPFQNSPLPPSLGGMPPFSMMNTPPRPMHMNGNRPPIHPGEDMTSDGQNVFCQIRCKPNIMSSKSMDVARHMLLARHSINPVPLPPIIAGKIIAIKALTAIFPIFIWSRLHLSYKIDCNVPYW